MTHPYSLTPYHVTTGFVRIYICIHVTGPDIYDSKARRGLYSRHWPILFAYLAIRRSLFSYPVSPCTHLHSMLMVTDRLVAVQKKK